MIHVKKYRLIPDQLGKTSTNTPCRDVDIENYLMEHDLYLALEDYNAEIKECSRHNQNPYNLNPYTIDTRQISQISTETFNQWRERLWGIAEIKEGRNYLVTKHVTDDPQNVILTLTRGENIAEGRIHEDLGGGLYASDMPEYWMGRSLRRYDILKTLDYDQRLAMTQAIRKEKVEEEFPGYLSLSERNYLEERLEEWVETGNNGLWYIFANQPFNVQIEELVQNVLHQKPYQAHVVEMRLAGKFFDLTETSKLLDLKISVYVNQKFPQGIMLSPKAMYSVYLRDMGYDGMFTRMGFNKNPEIVVWNNSAIMQFGSWINPHLFSKQDGFELSSLNAKQMLVFVNLFASDKYKVVSEKPLLIVDSSELIGFGLASEYTPERFTSSLPWTPYRQLPSDLLIDQYGFRYYRFQGPFLFRFEQIDRIIHAFSYPFDIVVGDMLILKDMESFVALSPIDIDRSVVKGEYIRIKYLEYLRLRKRTIGDLKNMLSPAQFQGLPARPDKDRLIYAIQRNQEGLFIPADAKKSPPEVMGNNLFEGGIIVDLRRTASEKDVYALLSYIKKEGYDLVGLYYAIEKNQVIFVYNPAKFNREQMGEYKNKPLKFRRLEIQEEDSRRKTSESLDLEAQMHTKILRSLLNDSKISKIDAWQDYSHGDVIDNPVFTNNYRFDFDLLNRVVFIINKIDYFAFAKELVQGKETKTEASLRRFKEDNTKFLAEIVLTIEWMKKQPEITSIILEGVTSDFPSSTIYQKLAKLSPRKKV